MTLRHIDIPQLSVSRAKMRQKGRGPELTNILPLVRARGVLVPLIVRQKSCSEPVEGRSGWVRCLAARHAQPEIAPAGEGR